MEQISTVETESQALPDIVEEELSHYQEQIKRYRAGEVDETKMQKLRLHFGTYAQRQEGVQMQRIKIPGGVLTADQLVTLADAADRFGSGFIHFTTREDAQIYYVKLEEAPTLLRFLAASGITSREACGNTVRNITACYRAGTSATEAFNVSPYADALFRYLVRNKYNQNLGRKFKITFEGCADDHSGLRIHDIGLWAVTQTRNGNQRRGFRVYLGGGLGAAPHLAHLYTEFLPVEELFNLATATLRLFDRYGERKARMKARMKFLIETMGWEKFYAALEEERQLVGEIPLSDYVEEELVPESGADSRRLQVLDPRTGDSDFQAWVRDSVIEHKVAGFRGVHVRVKLGDLTAARARLLSEVVRRFSSGQLRISIEQNIYLPWVREERLLDLYVSLNKLSLAESGAGTIADVTTCPGSDTCRLGIASAKGLGSALADSFKGPLAPYAELARPLRIKISGCPNGCAQHSIANIGFYAAALSHEERGVPAHFVTVGGQTLPDRAQFGLLLGKFPAKNCVKVTENLLHLFERDGLPAEDFNAFVSRTGIERLREVLDPLRQVPSFADDPSFYEDYGHEHERFAVRKGIKGECAGSTVAETVPTIDAAQEWLAQAEALVYHKEYQQAALAAYEAAAAGARVPLYQHLVDPFTSEEALWEFENLFVLSGQARGDWDGVSSRFEQLKVSCLSQGSVDGETAGADFNGNHTEARQTLEATARQILDEARKFVSYCALERKETGVAA
ncbi:MAG: nitrite/sulfite reductase [Pyrinomonadaceae bacterium]|nr:nitrite/sulfite reductase [Pyrinomonadaceae bacterium]